MTNQFKSTWWSIELSPGWTAEQEEKCASFWRDDGVGALQISAYRHDSGIVPKDDVDDFTKGEFPEETALQTVSCGAFAGVGVSYVVDGQFWLKRWVHQGPLLLYVTYNSDAGDQEAEMQAVNQMLATLKPVS